MANNAFLLSLSAFIALLPASVMPWRTAARRDGTFWLVTAVALAGSVAWVLVELRQVWRADFSAALWVTVTVSLVLYAVLAATTREVWRLAPLLFPYLALLGLIATVWSAAPAGAAVVPNAWLGVHIAVSVLTYGLVTLAAVAGVAVLIKERAIRAKRAPGRLADGLPAVADAERLQVRLLAAGEVVLGAGLVTGMAAQYLVSGALLALDHKTVLALATFVVIGLLLLAHARTGERGRRVARYALAAYLLLFLAYPGVKFVTDVLVG